MGGQQLPARVRIVVSGNSGSITSNLSGEVIGIGVDAPGGATWDLNLVEADGMGIFTTLAVSGDAYIQFSGHLWGDITVSLSNATDGTYFVKLYYRQ